MSIALRVAAVAAGMILVERLWPGRRLPPVPGFLPRALCASALQAGAVWLAGVAWEPWMQSAGSGGPAAALPCWAGAGLGYLVITFVYYLWHRARHEVPLLWRWLHQMHHSPARLEVVTSFYKHPLEILANGLLSSAVLYLILGLRPQVAALSVLLTGLAELFYHWNVRTPRWLGYLIQRPEMHRWHHARGLHRDNYSDLPLWDLLFGTFHNPRDEVRVCGFGGAAEQRVGRLLWGRPASAERAS